MKNYFLPLTILLFVVSCENTYAEFRNLKSAPVLELALDDTSETNGVDYEFEGMYKVGNTSCIVKPIKMAFQVKWLKGRGVMNFFFDQITPDGKTIFVSEASGKSRDKFVFDNNHYNSGVFIREDGKVFTVKKLMLR